MHVFTTLIATIKLVEHSMSVNIPAQPTSPLNEFGLNLRATLQSHMAGIDADLAKEDESRNDFFDKV